MTSHIAGNRRSLHIAARYALGALAFAALACFTGYWGLLLGWIALSLAIIALAYSWLGPRVYRKRDGRIPLWIRMVLGPHVLGLFVVRCWQFQRMKQPWNEISSAVFLGRLLLKNHARNAVDLCGITAVLDLTAEHAEAAPFCGLVYRNIPVLDLLPPSVEELRTAAEFIHEHAQQGRVYVHCGLGKSRSALAVAAYLLHSGQADSVSDACEKVCSARPEAIFDQHAQRNLEAFANSRDRIVPSQALMVKVPSASI